MKLRPGLIFLLGSACCGAVAANTADSNPGTPWPATDGLGRVLPLATEVGVPRPDRFVGIFYFLWQSTEVRAGAPGGEPYNVAQILAQDPDALKKPGSPLWGPIGVYHYWAEPLFGYYANDDPWVLRRHAQWLADAGVDTLIFDATNAQTYRDVYLALVRHLRAGAARGRPHAADRFHGEYRSRVRRPTGFIGSCTSRANIADLWFHWQGKPLLLCDPAEAGPKWKDFFTLRRAHWPFTLINTPYAWHWEATFPQPYGYTDDPEPARAGERLGGPESAARPTAR